MKKIRLSRLPNAFLNKVLSVRSERGPYRFLVRDWGRVSDIQLIEQMMASEFCRLDLHALPLPVKSVKSFLLIAPHQDDEAIGAGGTMLLAKAAGAKSTVLYLTDGVQGGRKFPDPAEVQARTRHNEAAEACAMMGAEMLELGINNMVPAPTPKDLERFYRIIFERKPQVILTPWVLDNPAKHRISSHMLYLADRKFGLPDCEVWGYQVHNTPYPNGYVEFTEVAEEKRRMLQCFRSQNEAYIRYDHLAMGMAAWNTRFMPNAPVARYAELFFTLPLREKVKLVEQLYFHDLVQTYQGDRTLAHAMATLHSQVLIGDLEKYAGKRRPQRAGF